MKTRLLILTAILALTTPAFAAGGDSGSIEAGLYTGYGFLDDYGQGTSALNLEDDILFGVRLGWWFTQSWSVEGSWQRLNTQTDFAAAAMLANRGVDIDSLRLNILYNFNPGSSFRPYLTAGFGTESLDAGSVFDEDDSAFNAGGGLRWFVSPNWALRLDGRYVRADTGGPVNMEQDNIEVSYGLAWTFGGGAPADDDGDGVANRKDDCPATPAGAVVDSKGCPVDSDGDGVYDGLDRCPGTRKGYPVDRDGCAIDSDGDGVVDGADACPNTPKGAAVDSKGCPTDSDRDGVFDGLDRCPDTPAGATVDSSGCSSDSDGDGVADGIDRCPGTPRGATVDTAGCPTDEDADGVPDGIDRCPGTPRGTRVDERGCQLLFDDAKEHLVLEGVKFQFNSSELTTDARAILHRVARAMKQNPEAKIEIAGFTDSVGNDGYNLKLSQRRAESVRDYLVSLGVNGARLVPKGYGKANPIADNGSDHGREQNRRVSLKKLGE